MNLLKHLRTALRQAWLSYEYDFTQDTEGWTDIDGRRLAAFFKSETGLKLKQRLTNYVLRAAVYGAKQSDVVRHAGITEGIQLGIKAIEDHFYVSPIRNTGTSPTKQEKSEPRRLTPLL